ncbi:uncharacterized protein KIAA1841 homolog isoform X2 [Cephus cinctus]|uniref:Uncharacterized protein KIAA1841 homolog isoform X2 n=1 Tax=Cephus cinctus TaxID=211228 RepID=A0AAJ7FL44_CEPCN|nr:uncharacterized protein KIAA1841 homolog isoform X2 [Cephus cinctus]
MKAQEIKNIKCSGSLTLRDLSQEAPTSLSGPNSKRGTPDSAFPMSPKCDTQSATSSGMYLRKLPERLQKMQNEKCPELTVQMFFEFMRTAYQVNDSFEELATTLTANSEIDWNKLAKSDLNSQIEAGDATPLSPINQTASGNEGADRRIETEVCPEICKPPVHENKLQDPSLLASHTRVRRVNARKEHIQKPGSTAVTFAQSLLAVAQGDTSDTPHDGQKLVARKDDKDKDQESRERSQEATGTELTTKKGKTAMAVSVSDSKEHLLAKIMKKKLSDILHEGLLDSVLPYMLPKTVVSQPIIKKSMVNVEVKKTASSGVILESKTASVPFSKDKEKNKHLKRSFENEVEIHVCDEAKSIKKDFRCPQKLLVQKMCYFADVTAGQKLEEMDISVHCDIVIFDWLMRWVKKDIIKKSEWPILEASNVIPIMVSASFLQMEPLLENCLIFCHDNMTEVLKTSAILTCLNDNLLTRLASLFSNVEVEAIKDKKDKIQSRLFCKLIISLVDSSPDNKRGHYSSLSTLIKCGKCGETVIKSASDSVPCVPSAMSIDSKGELHSMHTRDSTWTLNDYIVSLRGELRSWRKVYWRLWADCHFLLCRQCGTYFPIHQFDWCCYHPEVPQFFVNEQQRSTPFPLGRYPCCSQRAYRFETLPNKEGCRFREHVPVVSTDKEVSIMSIFAGYRDVISLEPPQLFFPEKITRLVARDPSLQPGKLACKEPMWWDGIELVPSRPRLGLLVSDSLKPSRKSRPLNSQVADASLPNSSLAGSEEDDGVTACGDSSADEESYNSEESRAWSPFKQYTKFKRKARYYAGNKRSDSVRSWSANLTVRYNQDNQRDFEERASAQMISLLTKRTSIECGLLPKINSHGKHHVNSWNYAQPLGGTYVKLEAEFREQLVQSYKFRNSSQTKWSGRVKSSKIF